VAHRDRTGCPVDDHHFVRPEGVPELKEKYGLKLLGEE